MSIKENGRYTSYKELSDPGQIIGKRREELQVSQTWVSKELGYKNPNFISMMEKGTAMVPIPRCLEIAELLEMDKAWFLEKVLNKHHPGVAEFLFNVNTLEGLLEGRERTDLPKIIPGSGMGG